MDDLNTTTEIVDVREARRRLEVVRPIVAAMMRVAEEIGEIRGLLSVSPRMPVESRRAHFDRLERLHGELDQMVRQLNREGAVVKSALDGLIDFYAWRDGELVLLCWRHGEEALSHWHGMKAGFAGRQPIDGDPHLG